MYSEFWVIKGDAWLPALFGISNISAVRNVERSIRAIRGVLLPLAKAQRPSCSPFVWESLGLYGFLSADKLMWYVQRNVSKLVCL